MRKIVVTQFISLDGVIDTPMWSAPYWNDDIANFKKEESEACDALLLGRVTYDGFALAWPDSKDEGAPQINAMPKYVVSNTLTNATWNNSHIISGDVVEKIKALKAGAGKNLLVYGSANLIQTLMAHDLVDDYRLLVYPVVLGSGTRLFQENNNLTLNLVSSVGFSNGVLALCYQPASKK
jgi:dihydrofolate reductase